MASQLFNALAIREISQYLCFGINPLTHGDFLTALQRSCLSPTYSLEQTRHRASITF